MKILTYLEKLKMIHFLVNPLSDVGKYSDHWKFDVFMVLDP